MITGFDQLVERASDTGPLRVAVILPYTEASLRCIVQANLHGMAQCTLVGDVTAIRTLGSEKGITGISPAALEVLMAHDWPGNVRELINAVEFAFVTCPGGEILPSHLPPSLAGAAAPCAAPEGLAAGENPAEAAMRAEIAAALRETNGHKAQAAARLGVSRVTLWKRMKKLGMEP